jgi:hypothetical protein
MGHVGYKKNPSCRVDLKNIYLPLITKNALLKSYSRKPFFRQKMAKYHNSAITFLGAFCH